MQIFFAVWSAFEHRFTTRDDSAECLTCGAAYSMSPDEQLGDGYGRYHTWNGDDPVECFGTVAPWHGEAPCQSDNGRGCRASQGGTGEHLASEHGCNCLTCTG